MVLPDLLWCIPHFVLKSTLKHQYVVFKRHLPREYRKSHFDKADVPKLNERFNLDRSELNLR